MPEYVGVEAATYLVDVKLNFLNTFIRIYKLIDFEFVFEDVRFNGLILP
jgi:hypothetical protein